MSGNFFYDAVNELRKEAGRENTQMEGETPITDNVPDDDEYYPDAVENEDLFAEDDAEFQEEDTEDDGIDGFEGGFGDLGDSLMEGPSSSSDLSDEDEDFVDDLAPIVDKPKRPVEETKAEEPVVETAPEPVIEPVKEEIPEESEDVWETAPEPPKAEEKAAAVKEEKQAEEIQVKEIKKDFVPVPIAVTQKAPLSGFAVNVNGAISLSGHCEGVSFLGGGQVVIQNDGKLVRCNFHVNTIDVNGYVEGDIAGEEIEKITIRNGGKVNGNCCANEIIVERGIVVGNLFGANVEMLNGAVKGNIIANEELHVDANSKVKGDVEAGHLNLEKGSMISGSCKQYSSGVNIPDDIFE